MTAKQKRKVKQIKEVLDKQYFYDFYAREGGEYDKYIANRRDKKADTQIDRMIFEMFEKVIGV